MKKNLKDRMVSILLVFAVIGTSYGFRVVATDMITEISVKEISGVSENDAESAEDDNETMDTESMVEDTDIDADEQLILITDDVDDIPVWGDRTSRKDIVERKKLHPEENNYVFTLPDCYTWKYQQSYARKEIFEYLNDQRMDPVNHKDAMKDNDGNWKSLTDCGMELLIEDIRDENDKVIRQDRYDFIYDYNLEAVAMQRAAELVVLNSGSSHLRPDYMKPAETYLEAWSEPVKKMDSEEDISADNVNPYWYGSTNELITVYESDLDKRPQHWDYMGIVEDFMEKDKPAGGQPHREAILTRSYRRIGIGCIKTDENKYFIAVELGTEKYEPDYYDEHPELAGTTIPLASETTAVDTYMPVTIRIAPGQTQCSLLDARYGNTNVLLKEGETFDFGDKYFCKSSNTVALWKGSDTVALENTWVSSDESVAKVEGTVITAVGTGECTIELSGNAYFRASINIKVASSPAKPSQTPAPAVKPSADPSPSPAPSVKPNTAPSAAPSVQPSSTPAQAPQKIEVAKQFKKTCTVKYADIKKKKKTLKLGVKVNKGKAHGVVTYKVTKYPKGAKKCVTVNKKGVVTIKKRAKKGTYKIKVTANANAIMKKATKTVTIKIK